MAKILVFFLSDTFSMFFGLSVFNTSGVCGSGGGIKYKNSGYLFSGFQMSESILLARVVEGIRFSVMRLINSSELISNSGWKSIFTM